MEFVAAVVVDAVVVAAVVVAAVEVVSGGGFCKIFALTFELLAAIIFELLSGPVDIFILDEVWFDEPLAVVDDDESDGAEIVMFKNGLKNCQNIAFAPLDWK